MGLSGAKGGKGGAGATASGKTMVSKWPYNNMRQNLINIPA